MPPVRRPAVGAPGHEPDSFGLAFTVTSATVSSSPLAAGVVANCHVHAPVSVARPRDAIAPDRIRAGHAPAAQVRRDVPRPMPRQRLVIRARARLLDEPEHTVRMPRSFTCFTSEFALNPLPDETAVG